MMHLALAILALFGFADLRTNWNALVEAERSFARTSLASGTKTAFLSVLAEDSVIFRPRAVNGKQWTQQSAPSTAQLNWEPEFADIAQAGDLGYTTGPWEVRRTAQDPPGAFGHYVTLWKKQPDGEWKVVLDNGIGHDKFPKPARVDSPALPKDIAAAASAPSIEAAKRAVANADSTANKSIGSYLAEDVRLYRDGSFPLLGKPAALKRLAQTSEMSTARLTAILVSDSADLAYSYGATDSANYVRIWKKQRADSWKIVLDLVNPVPKQ